MGAALSASGMASDSFNWFRSNIFDRIQLSGYRQIGFHSHRVEGDRNSFNSLTYSGQGDRSFTDLGNVTVVGNDVVGVLNFKMTLSDNRFDDPEGEQISLNYLRGPLAIDAGDIQGSLLNTNPLASVNRSLKGVSAQYKTKNFGVKLLHSETKGSARTITLSGNNSPGPYYLQNGRLVTGSESVQVDGQVQRLNQDYVIDYESGSITFVRSIAPTSTILISYEAYDFNSATGSVQGAGTSYNFGKIGRVGLTYLRSESGSGSGLSSRTEAFEGYGAPGTPYFLQFVPLKSDQFPILIKVDSIPQTEGIDYYFDASNPAVFFFRRFIPSTSLVEAIYTPRPTSVQDGDREVVGIDYRLPFGSEGSYLQYNQALGTLKNDVTPLSGTARTLSGSYKRGGLNVSANWRSIPADYVSIESRSFNRNDTGAGAGIDYKRGPISYSARHNDVKIGSRLTNDDGSQMIVSSRETESRAGVRFDKDRVSWGADWNRIKTSRPSYASQLDTLSFNGAQRDATTDKKIGRFKSGWGADYQTGYLVDNSVRKNVALNTLRYNLDYRPDTNWMIGGRTSVSQVRYAGDTGTGRDLGLDVRYVRGDKFSLGASYIDSNSGEFATLSGFQGSYGTGYNGNGFSSGLGTSSLVGGSNVKATRLSSSYRPSRKLSLEARADFTNTSGSYSSNTESRTFSLGADVDLGRGHLGGFNVNNTTTKFLGGALTSNSTYLTGYLSARPPGPWSYRASGNLLLAGGGEYAQNSIFAEANVTYRLNPRQNLGVQFMAGQSTGYLPQTDSLASIFYEYQLYRNVSLIGSYKVRNLRNLDPLASSPGYRSRGFDLELSFSFGR